MFLRNARNQFMQVFRSNRYLLTTTLFTSHASSPRKYIPFLYGLTSLFSTIISNLLPTKLADA